MIILLNQVSWGIRRKTIDDKMPRSLETQA